MPSVDHFVGDLAVVLGVAAVTNVVFRRLGQSTVLGYLLAGLVVGPYIPIPIFADAERIGALSEFGVVLVMFAVGLEFSVRRLLRVLPLAGFTGLVQVCALGLAGFALARGLGFTTLEGVFLGGCIAISSTMVVAKVFAEQPPAPRVRELVFGVLVVQDLAAILIVAALTAVATGAGLSSEVLVSTLGGLAGVLVAMVVGGLLVVPRFVRFVAGLGSPETLLVAAVGVCFGFANLAEHLGYSVALGAFLAGTLVAESGRTHEVEHLVHPVRDLFAAVFFVSVGMTVDPRVALQHGWLALAVTAVVIGGQLLVVSAAGVLSGNGVRRSVTAALSLGQIGEFAFIIAAIGVSGGVVGAFLQPVVVTVAVLTAFTTPLFVRASSRLAHGIDTALPRPLQTFAALCESWFDELRRAPAARRMRSHLRNAVIVIGIDATVIGAAWGLVAWWGDEIATWMRSTFSFGEDGARMAVVGLGVVVTLPLVLAISRSARRAGQLLAERVIARSPEATEGTAPDVGAAPRRAFVVTLQSMIVFVSSVPVVVAMTPVVGIEWALAGLAVLMAGLSLYFWRSALDLQGHVRAGASALAELLERQLADDAPSLPTPQALLPGLGTVEAVVIDPAAAPAGRSLAELDLRVVTGATIVAIGRDGDDIVMPSGHHRLQAGDTVVVAGAPHAVEAAVTLLGGPRVED